MEGFPQQPSPEEAERNRQALRDGKLPPKMTPEEQKRYMQQQKIGNRPADATERDAQIKAGRFAPEELQDSFTPEELEELRKKAVHHKNMTSDRRSVKEIMAEMAGEGGEEKAA